MGTNDGCLVEYNYYVEHGEIIWYATDELKMYLIVNIVVV